MAKNNKKFFKIKYQLKIELWSWPFFKISKLMGLKLKDAILDKSEVSYGKSKLKHPLLVIDFLMLLA